MALTPQQQQEALKIQRLALQGGLSGVPNASERARELALVAYHESSLDPSNFHGRSSGAKFVPGKTAGGDFQLLSPGYVNKAQQTGGIFNTKANLGAILPDYLRFWQQHPNAPVGLAGAKVERSGEGADYYGANLDLIPAVGGKPTAFAGIPDGQAQGDTAFAPGFDPKQAFASKMIEAVRHGSVEEAAQAVQTLRGAPARPTAGQRGLYASESPEGNAGWVTVSKGADRQGVGTHPEVVSFVAEVAHEAGVPLTIGTGTNHDEYTVNGNVSDHWEGWAGDVPATGAALIRAGQAALIVAGADPAWAKQQKGGLFNVNGHQIIFNTHEGGDHTNHLHVSVPHG